MGLVTNSIALWIAPGGACPQTVAQAVTRHVTKACPRRYRWWAADVRCRRVAKRLQTAAGIDRKRWADVGRSKPLHRLSSPSDPHMRTIDLVVLQPRLVTPRRKAQISECRRVDAPRVGCRPSHEVLGVAGAQIEPSEQSYSTLNDRQREVQILIAHRVHPVGSTADRRLAHPCL